MSLVQLKNNQVANDLPFPGLAVHLEPVDMLVQPPNMLHMPITLETCLMSGTMHWHTTHLHDIILCTGAAVEQPAITNEAMSPNFMPKLENLL